MKKDLANKQIYDDFISKTILTDNEKDVLFRYVRNDTIVKIADDTKQGTTTISRTIAALKEKYQKYKELELIKLHILSGKK